MVLPVAATDAWCLSHSCWDAACIRLLPVTLYPGLGDPYVPRTVAVAGALPGISHTHVWMGQTAHRLPQDPAFLSILRHIGMGLTNWAGNKPGFALCLQDEGRQGSAGTSRVFQGWREVLLFCSSSLFPELLFSHSTDHLYRQQEPDPHCWLPPLCLPALHCHLLSASPKPAMCVMCMMGHLRGTSPVTDKAVTHPRQP